MLDLKFSFVEEEGVEVIQVTDGLQSTNISLDSAIKFFEGYLFYRFSSFCKEYNLSPFVAMYLGR